MKLRLLTVATALMAMSINAEIKKVDRENGIISIVNSLGHQATCGIVLDGATVAQRELRDREEWTYRHGQALKGAVSNPCTQGRSLSSAPVSIPVSSGGPSSASLSSGELDGSGYICRVGSGSQQLVWSPWFRDGRAFISVIAPPARGEEPELRVDAGGYEYSVVGDLVSFDLNFFNRKTLRIGQENKSPHDESYGEIMWTLRCEEAASLDNFRETMKELLRQREQAMVASAPAGELDGLGLICKVGTHVHAWEFLDGGVTGRFVNTYGEKPKLEIDTSGVYSVSTDYVKWHREDDPVNQWILDRKTLRKGQMNRQKGKEGEIMWSHQCKTATPESIKTAMEADLLMRQVWRRCEEESTDREKIMCVAKAESKGLSTDD